ncbi:MAG: hypothetical protein K1X78_14690 [Verrucomicrobiaceae bacterium]|nr:hypothetical protein [Verrucomicrobiaceae bacterium]
MIQKIVELCREQPKVCHGVTLRVHPRLEMLWLIGAWFDPDDPGRWWRQERFVLAPWYTEDWNDMWRRMPLVAGDGHTAERWLEIFSHRYRFDFSRRAPRGRGMRTDDIEEVMKNHWAERGNHPQLLISVANRLGANQQRLDLPEEGGERFRFQVVQQQRALAHTCAVTSRLRPVRGGASIGHSSYDPLTLGGLLEDTTNGTVYGLTCWHGMRGSVSADQPAQADGGGPSDCIGQVTDFEQPHVISYGSPRQLSAVKNPRKLPSGGTSTPANLDVALVKLSSAAGSGTLGLPTLAGVLDKDDLAQKQPMKLSGRTSGTTWVSCGGLALFRLLKDSASSDEFCYDELIEVRSPHGAQPVQPGDSGAWLQAQDSTGTDMWAGMVVGGDSQIGYAMPASAIENWWTRRRLNLAIK